eukprot:227468_1
MEKKKFKIDKKNKVDRDGLIAYMKQKYSELNEINIRSFATDFDDDEDDRFQDSYKQSVKDLLNELKTIKPSNISIEERVKYAIQIADVLNNNSPDLTVNLNFTFWKDQVLLFEKNAEKAAIERIKQKGNAVTVIKRVSFADFCKLIGDRGKIYYGQNIYDKAITSNHYDKNDGQFTKFANKYIEEKQQDQYALSAETWCRNSYDTAMQNIKSTLINKGRVLMNRKESVFRDFVYDVVDEEIKRMKFNGNADLPSNICARIQRKKREICNDISYQTDGLMTFDDDYLSLDVLEKRWDTKINQLR